MKGSKGLIIAAVLVVLGLLFLSSRGRNPPLIPSDVQHKGLTKEEECTTCHAPRGTSPLKEGHPPKEQCFICHKSQNRR
jgi:hypothetical protein